MLFINSFKALILIGFVAKSLHPDSIAFARSLKFL